MISSFISDRLILVAAMAVLLVLGGGVVFFSTLPPVVSPALEVSAVYPGANAEVVARTVGAPIESQIPGVEGLTSMTRHCGDDGRYTLTLTFQPGSDLNISQVLVQNRVSLATPLLPAPVNRQGISVVKTSPPAVSPLFSSAWARGAGMALLVAGSALSLGLLWLVSVLLGKERRLAVGVERSRTPSSGEAAFAEFHPTGPNEHSSTPDGIRAAPPPRRATGDGHLMKE